MTATLWAVWHPTHEFNPPYHQGGVAFAELDDAVRLVRNLNREDRTTNRTGWRAVKVKIERVTE